MLVRLLLAGLVAVVCVSTAATTALGLVASRANYPGGVALEALHRAIDAENRKPDKVRCIVWFAACFVWWSRIRCLCARFQRWVSMFRSSDQTLRASPCWSVLLTYVSPDAVAPIASLLLDACRHFDTHNVYAQ